MYHFISDNNLFIYNLSLDVIFSGESLIIDRSGVTMLDLSGIQAGEYIIKLKFGQSTMSENFTLSSI